MSGKPWLFRWRQAVKDSELPSSARHVAHALSDYGDEQGRSIHPSAERLAHDCGLKLRAVRTHLRVLQDAGWIVAQARYNAKGRTTNAYALAIPGGFQPRPFERGDDKVGADSACTVDGCVQNTTEVGADSACTVDGWVQITTAVGAENDSGGCTYVHPISPRDLSSKNSPYRVMAPERRDHAIDKQQWHLLREQVCAEVHGTTDHESLGQDALGRLNAAMRVLARLRLEPDQAHAFASCWMNVPGRHLTPHTFRNVEGWEEAFAFEPERDAWRRVYEQSGGERLLTAQYGEVQRWRRSGPRTATDDPAPVVADDRDEVADAEIVNEEAAAPVVLYPGLNVGRTRRVPCPTCRGEGMRWVTEDTRGRCGDCRGTGSVEVAA